MKRKFREIKIKNVIIALQANYSSCVCLNTIVQLFLSKNIISLHYFYSQKFSSLFKVFTIESIYCSMTNWENNKQTSTQKMVGMADFFLLDKRPE